MSNEDWYNLAVGDVIKGNSLNISTRIFKIIGKKRSFDLEFPERRYLYTLVDISTGRQGTALYPWRWSIIQKNSLVCI